MILDNLLIKILNSFKINLTDDQRLLVQLFCKFASQLPNRKKEILVIKGYAGTGKTTIISKLLNEFTELGIKSVLLAPTGRAAKVFTTISGLPAYTIHKKIYRQKSSNDGFGRFVLNKNLHTNTLFVIDEASMISNTNMEGSVFGSGRLLDDILEYVYEGKNCKLILMGDIAQLPPVSLFMSPALDTLVLESYNFAVFEITLRQIVRQETNSSIISNATTIRNHIINENESIPKLQINKMSDVVNLSGEELIENITSSYDKYGIAETIIICRSNKRANTYNEGIRRSIFWHDSEITSGDLLMVVKNNYYWAEEYDSIDFIANGDIVEVVRVKNYEERYGHRFANLTVRFLDYFDTEMDVKVFLDTLYIDKAAFSQQENRDLFYSIEQDYNYIKNKKVRYESIKADKFFNALQIKFAYAITCHKAQGGQWKRVFVDQGFFKPEMIDKEYLRWLYTAFTRSTDKLFLVNFPKSFFESF